MSVSSSSLQFNGAKNSVRIFSDGEMAMHTTAPSKETTVMVISIARGTHQLRTLDQLSVTALLGPCKITVDSGTTKKVTVLKTGKKMGVSIGSTFTVNGDGTVLRLVPVQGPGLGNPRVPDETIP